MEILTISVKDFKTLTEKCHSHVMGESAGTPERRHSVSPSVESKKYMMPYSNVKYCCIAGDRSGRFSRSNSRQSSPNR